MKITRSRLVAVVVSIGLSGLAWQSAHAWQTALATLKLTQGNLEAQLPDLNFSTISGETITAAKLLTPEQRTAAVREICAAIKTIAMSDAFQAAYAARIKNEFHAVDHGLDLDATPAVKPVDPETFAEDAQVQAAVQIASMFRSLPAEALKNIFESDQETWNEMLKDPDADPEDKARVQKSVDQAKTIAPLLQSDPEAFKKAYSLLKSVELGGPSTEAALAAAIVDSQRGNSTQRSEQSAWNQHNFKAVWKKRLTYLVSVAGTVDFDAQTRKANGKDVFVNPDYERESGDWKVMYRIGRGPVTAASEFAKAWLRELN